MQLAFPSANLLTITVVKGNDLEVNFQRDRKSVLKRVSKSVKKLNYSRVLKKNYFNGHSL